MRDRLDELIHLRPGDGDQRGAAGEEGGAGGAGRGRPAPLDAAEAAPLDAAEGDPDAARVAALPGYAAAGAGDGDVAVGPPSQDHRPG